MALKLKKVILFSKLAWCVFILINFFNKFLSTKKQIKLIKFWYFHNFIFGMKKIFKAFFILTFLTECIYAQQSFPKNGVDENFKPIYAFTNANIIISPNKVEKKYAFNTRQYNY